MRRDHKSTANYTSPSVRTKGTIEQPRCPDTGPTVHTKSQTH